jgi:hypothetical protein
MLEALFLAAGVSPELAMRTRTWRGVSDGQMSGTHEDLHEALWGDLFHKFQSKQPALISLKGTGEQERSVTVWLNKRGAVQAIPPGRDRPGAQVVVVPIRTPIEFKYKVKGLREFTIAPTFEDGNLVYPPAPASHIKGSFFAANRSAPSTEVANRFSALSKSFLEGEFIEKFTHLYNGISTLSIEMVAGAPMVFAGVESLPEKIPLSLASGGMSKLAAILLAITDQSGGIILVDEIENGFYYKRLPLMWNAILDFARFYHCQIFVSTHSEECLKAAASLAEKSPEEFAIIRTSLEGGETKVRSFAGEQFVMAMQEDMEVR